MKMGLTISVVGHAAALLWAVVTFGVTPHNAPPPDALPIDIISASDFSKMTAGQKNAPKTAAAKPLVEKVGDTKRTDNEAIKVSEKPEIITASAQTSETPPAPKQPEPKPAPKAEAKPDAKPEVEKKPEAKPDAEALKKEEKKPEPKKEEAKVQLPPKKPPPPQPKALDFKDIEQKLAMLDKREPRRQAYAGETLNSTPSLGTATGNAPELSQNVLNALIARLSQCWNLPAGALDSKDLSIKVQFSLKQDGSLSVEPKVINRSANPFFQVASESALRAVRTCAPFNFLPVAKYELWRDLEITFDPQYMFRS